MDVFFFFIDEFLKELIHFSNAEAKTESLIAGLLGEVCWLTALVHSETSHQLLKAFPWIIVETFLVFEAMNPPEFGDPPRLLLERWSWPLWFGLIMAITILVFSSQKWPFFGGHAGVETFLPQPEINLALSSILHTTLYWRPSDWDYILIRKLLTEVISQEIESFSNKLTFSHTPFETSGTTLPHVATSFSFLSDPGAQSIFFF